ncbi:MAG TPA: nucleotidyltransferase domain-containing protein [Pyrinomonadaceae bacterium]|jgi:predicted nucleotidyltransferase
MKNGDKIKNVCRQIVREFQPEKIILFGSQAYGDPDSDSDTDLLVILPFEGRRTEQGIKIRQRIKSSLPLDLLIRTPKEVTESLSLGDIFIKDIIENGKVLYESDYARMDR